MWNHWKHCKEMEREVALSTWTAESPQPGLWWSHMQSPPARISLRPWLVPWELLAFSIANSFWRPDLVIQSYFVHVSSMTNSSLICFAALLWVFRSRSQVSFVCVGVQCSSRGTRCWSCSRSQGWAKGTVEQDAYMLIDAKRQGL